MEETDSNGIDPPLKHWKLKARAHATETDAENEPEGPPLKKTKVAKDVERKLREKWGKKTNESVREAIAASIQQSRMAVTRSTDSNSDGVGEKVQAAVNEVKNPLKIVSKCFSDGPQWNGQGKGREVSEKGD